MRGQNRARLRLQLLSPTLAAALSAVILLAAGAVAQEIIPRLTGAQAPMSDVPAPTLANPISDDVRRMRAYPEQPPVIPHSIEGYQLSVNANRCLECHRRQFAEAVQAPMISITHFIDRDGQMLADVSPRRYFCIQCHVQQTDARPLVENIFVDMTTMRPMDDE